MTVTNIFTGADSKPAVNRIIIQFSSFKKHQRHLAFYKNISLFRQKNISNQAPSVGGGGGGGSGCDVLQTRTGAGQFPLLFVLATKAGVEK